MTQLFDYTSHMRCYSYIHTSINTSLHVSIQRIIYIKIFQQLFKEEKEKICRTMLEHGQHVRKSYSKLSRGFYTFSTSVLLIFVTFLTVS